MILDAARVGAILGIGVGLVIAIVIREIVIDFKAWRRFLEQSRQIRSMKDWK